jgi:single-strand DNA-binding protein
VDDFPLVEEHRKEAIDMAQGNQVTIVGNLVEDPELRYTPNGAAVATFRVAVSKRIREDNGQWRDGETSFFNCNVWRQQAENVAESFSKGTRVIVVGRLRQRSWETPEGQKRSVVEIEVESCGPALDWAKATVSKTPRSDEAVYASASAGSASSGGSNGAAIDEEPPF